MCLLEFEGSAFKFQKAHKIIHFFFQFHIEGHITLAQYGEKGTKTLGSQAIPETALQVHFHKFVKPFLWIANYKSDTFISMA